MEKQIYISKQALDRMGTRYFRKKSEEIYQKYGPKVVHGEYIPLEKGLFIHQSPISTDLDIVVGRNDDHHQRLTEVKAKPTLFQRIINKIRRK